MEISFRDGDSPLELSLGQVHTIILRTLFGHFIEVEDVHFNHDSAVMLADFRDTAATDDDDAEDAQDDDQDSRITALAVLTAIYKHLEEHPDKRLLVTGHTDASGSDAYNLDLSRKRAENVRALLEGDRDAWVASCLDHHKVEDFQQLLLWMFKDHGWDTDPGVVDNVLGPNTKGATRRFKERFNTEFGASIAVNETFDRVAWESFHQVYETEILGVTGFTQTELDAVRQNLQWVDPGAAGCGENWPITGQHRSRVDRRVEIVLFDPGEEPTTPLRCHPSPTQCLKDDCEFRNPRLYTLQPLPVEPVLAPRFRVDVHLQMIWKDPAGVEHPFPEGLVAKISFGDGRAGLEEAIEEAGHLHFIADKRSQSFTLGFEHPQAAYFASPPAGGTDPERLVSETDSAALARQGWRIMRLPTAWDLGNCDWTIDGAAAPTYVSPDFTALDTLEAIGTADSPCRVELLPHWQYFKMLYFDRQTKQRLSVPPIVVEGFAAASASVPESQSNWTTSPEACQALPWIRRQADDGSALTKPDRDTVLKIRAKPQTFIDSSSTDRRLITKNPGSPSDDPGLTEGVDDPIDLATPGAARLAYYDLPEVWLSRTYFCRLSGGTGAPAAREGRYEDLAGEPTSDAAPLLFSLDDVVLTGPDLSPLAWQPNTTLANRFALFVNTFAGGTNLTSFGLYKPDGLLTTANRLSYFTQVPTAETGRNYIADYPDWTRLVVMGGNLFDCFDRRIPDSGSGVAGARAGVRWVDATPSGTGVATGSNHPALALVADASTHPFFAIQPFYQQEFFHRGINSRPGSGSFDEWNSPIAAGEARLATVGRYDTALLRCTDLDGDQEVAVAFRYHRYVFDYTSKTSLLTPANATQREQWADLFYSDCAERWNGDEAARGTSPPTVTGLAAGDRDAVNTSRTFILPKDPATKLKIPILNFAQGLDAALSHFNIQTAAESATSFMNSSKGTGELRANAGRPKTSRNFAGAHETGHAAGLPDEYGRRPSSSMDQVGFGSNHVPAAIFSGDRGAMMVFNKEVRARYLWHMAEWVRTIPALRTVEFKLQHGSEDYELPHYAHQATRPKRNYVYWPVRAVLRHKPSDPVLYDAYLFMLGADRYSTVRLVADLTGAAPPGEPPGRIDGILGVVIKARFDMQGWTNTTARKKLAAEAIARKFDRELNKRTLANFTVAANPDAPPEFKKCLLLFSLRFHDAAADNEHILTHVQAGGSAGFGAAADPRDLRVALANSAPANPQTEFAQLADDFFARACELLGMSADPSAANAYTKSSAYIPLVRSVAGSSVSPTITRRT